MSGRPGRRLLSREATRSLSIAFTLMTATGLVAGTSASFNGSTSNRDNKLATASLTAPQGLSATAAGTGVALSWTAGSFGGGTGFGHRVQSHSLGVEPDPRDGAQGPSQTCSAGDSFTTNAGRTNAATTTLTHAGVSAGVEGSYACYRVDTEYPASPATARWFSVNNNPVTTVMLGHVVKSVVSVNNGTFGVVEQGDALVITFNQPVNIATGPVSTDNPSGIPTSGQDVCVVSSNGQVNIGRTPLNTDCTVSQSVSVGRTVGVTMAPSGELPAYHATYTWSNCPVAGKCTTLTVTLGLRYRDDTNVGVTGITNPLFQPSTSGLTSATGGAALCATANTATSTCQPVPSGTI